MEWNEAAGWLWLPLVIAVLVIAFCIWMVVDTDGAKGELIAAIIIPPIVIYAVSLGLVAMCSGLFNGSKTVTYEDTPTEHYALEAFHLSPNESYPVQLGDVGGLTYDAPEAMFALSRAGDGAYELTIKVQGQASIYTFDQRYIAFYEDDITAPTLSLDFDLYDEQANPYGMPPLMTTKTTAEQGCIYGWTNLLWSCSRLPSVVTEDTVTVGDIAEHLDPGYFDAYIGAYIMGIDVGLSPEMFDQLG